MKYKVKKIGLAVMSLAMASLFGTSAVIQTPVKNGSVGNINAAANASNITKMSDEFTASLDASQFLNEDLVNSAASVKSYSDGTHRIIVEFESKSQLDLYLQNEKLQNTYADFTEYINADAGKAYAKNLINEQNDFFRSLNKTSLEYETRYTYTSILNAVSLVVDTKDIDKIEKMDGVKNVIYSEVYAQPTVEPTINVVDVYGTGIYDASDVKYKGDGMLVAVLDTGFDVAHNAFQTMPETEKLTLGGVEKIFDDLEANGYRAGSKTITAEDVYYNAKVPFAYDYADGDADVFAIANSHGVHVAGIIAGQDDSVTEEDDKAFKNGETFMGVAPNAQLMIGKVFSDKDTARGAETDDILAAVSDCITVGADVINMSLGSACGFSREEDGNAANAIYDKVYAAGVNLVIAAGNEASSAMGGAYGSTNLTSNPDSSTVGTPSVYHSALSVASISGQKASYMLLEDGTAVYFNESSSASGQQGKFVEELLNGETEKQFRFVVVPGYGRSSNYSYSVKEELDKGNCIAIVSRGETSFEEKQKIAFDNGAVACIIYNNMSGKISASLGTGKKIPTCTVSAAIGQRFVSLGKGTISLNAEYKAGPFMSDFSSWGPTNDLKIKPEITAHGGEITSSVVGGYAQYSGTSMACPNMAGAVALLRQHVAEETDLKGVALANRVNQLLMSTATIVYDENGLPYAVRRQGAGLGDINKAISTEAYLYVENNPKTKLELGDDPERSGVYTMQFCVENISSVEKTYELDVIAMTESVSIDNITVEEKAYLLDKAQKVFRVNGQYTDKYVTVAAGETAEITVTLALSAEEKAYLNENFENGMYVEGFVTLNDVGEGIDLSIPYLAYYGDWTDAPIFDASLYEVSKDHYDSSIKDEDKTIAAIYESVAIGRAYKEYSEYYLPLGQYLYRVPNDGDSGVESSVDKISIGNSYYGVYEFYAMYMGMLRGAGDMYVRVENAVTGEVLLDEMQHNIRKSYNTGPAVVEFELNASELGLINNEKYNIILTANLDYDSETVRTETREFSFYVDYQMPILENSVMRYEDNGDGSRSVYLDLEVYDNHYPQSIQLFTALSETEADWLTTYPIPITDSVRDGTSKISINITDYMANVAEVTGEYANTIGIRIDDYALNASAYLVNVNTTVVDEVEFNYTYKDANGDEVVASLAGETVVLRPGASVNLTEDVGVVSTANGEIEGKFSVNMVGYTYYVCSKLDAHGVECGFAYNETLGYTYKKGDYYYDAATGEVKQKEADDATATYAPYTKFIDIIAGPVVKNGNRYTQPDSKHFVCPVCGTEEVYSFNTRTGKITTKTFKRTMQDPMIHDVIFTSSNTNIVEVYNGFLYAVGEGEATITAKPSNSKDESNNVTFKVNVTGDIVNSFIEKITVGSYYNYTKEVMRSVSGNATTVDCGSELELYPKFSPWYVTEIADLTWQTSDPETAEIVESSPRSARVICKKPGGVTILISSPSNGLIGSFGIMIEEEYVMTSYYCYDYKGVGYSETYMENGEERKMLVIPANLGIVIMGYYTSDIDVDGTFEDSQNLDTVVVPQGVTALGASCFRNSSIRRIYLPSSIEQISSSAFSNCKNLEEVYWYDAGENSKSGIEYDADDNTYDWDVFYANVTEKSTAKRIVLSYSAFYNCNKLDTFDFSKVTAMFSSAFANCSKIQYADLSNLRYAESSIFSGCSALTNVTLNKDTALSSNAFANTGLKTVDFYGPTIVNNLFYNAKALEKIIIHNDLKSIGQNAFYNCTNLTEVVFEGSCQTIEKSAFSGCKALTEFTVPAGVTTIGDGAFTNCTNLETFYVDPASNVQAGLEVFKGCNVLKTIKIAGAGVSENYNTISSADGEYTLLTDGSGANIIMAAPNYPFAKGNVFTVATELGGKQVTEIGAYVYAGNSSLSGKEVVIPEGITKIGAGAFQGTKITKVIIPSTVTEIDSYAFANCSSLETVILLCDLKTISASTFENCGKLMNVQIPGSVETIGERAFYKTDIRSVSIGENVQTIGLEAFRDCKSLVEVNFSKQSVLETIGQAAFAGCESIKTIEMPDTVKVIKNNAFLSCSALTDVYVSAGLEVMEEYAFSITPALTTFVMGDGAKMIGDYAFYIPAGNNGFYYQQSLKNVTIPDSVESIGKFAFTGNTVLESLVIRGVRSIGDYAFHYATALKSVAITDAMESIGMNAFIGSSIRTIDLKYVEYFGDQSFLGTDVRFTSLDNAIEIGAGAFYNCQYLQDVTLPNVVKIGNAAFSTDMAQPYLQRITFGDKLKSIGMTIIFNSAVRAISLPASVEEIAEGAFVGCANMTTILVSKDNKTFFVENSALYKNLSNGTYELVAVPNGLRGYEAINEDYTQLTPFKIKEGTSRIGGWAMGYCQYVHAVEIPASVQSIGSYAFYNMGYAVLNDHQNIAATSRAPYAKFIFKGLQAPLLEAEYQEDVSLDEMYVNFVYNLGYLMSDIIIPVNAKGFESMLYKWYFYDVEYSEELIESDTKKLVDWLTTLDVTALTIEDKEKVTEMNMIYFMISNSQKALFITEENAAKLAEAVAKIAELQA